ncbi:MaoC/PaaZ C-terminal domain-containing protein [Gemmatimonas sp.]|uniref:MaoC/PaaZ C-terminal domain-containing protein n=1 Tax=Gemmatimonas sp. TaxID=1962908 RepID=UPI003562A91B
MTAWRIGDELPPRTDAPLTVTEFVRYQGASGDMNPVHHDQVAAEAVGYDRPLAVGMLGAGRLAAYLTDTFGPRAVRAFAVRFSAPAWPGDALTYKARVVDVVEVDDGHELVLEATCTTACGDVHVGGTARFRVG